MDNKNRYVCRVAIKGGQTHYFKYNPLRNEATLRDGTVVEIKISDLAVFMNTAWKLGMEAGPI